MKVTGMDITFVTNTNSDTDALELLRELGIPFIKDIKSNKTNS
jgi:ribosomal protein L5